MSLLVTLVLLVVALRSRPETILRSLLVCGLFGATAALTVPGLGAPVKPALFMLPFVVWWAVRSQGLAGVARHCAPSTPGLWLLLFLLWGLITAVFGPWIFEGSTMVYNTNRGSDLGLGVDRMPLAPTSTNLTQSVYAIAAVAAYLCARALITDADRIRRIGDAVLVLAGLNLVAVVINLGEIYLGLPAVLGVIKNANYAVTAGGTIGGLGRISGTFTETAAWSNFTLPLVAFTFILWRRGYRRRLSGPLCLLSTAAMVLSTSTTAYAGLLAVGGAIGLAIGWRHLVSGDRLRLGWLWALALALGAALCIVGLARPTFFGAVQDFFQVTLWRKLESSSGQERTAWNLQALSNFVDTWGLGAGLGSVRASSYPLVLLSNVGILGFLLYVTFVVRLLTLPVDTSDPEAATVVRAARWAMFGALVSASVSATVFDIGLQIYVYAAVAAGLAGARSKIETRTAAPQPPLGKRWA